LADGTPTTANTPNSAEDGLIGSSYYKREIEVVNLNGHVTE